MGRKDREGNKVRIRQVKYLLTELDETLSGILKELAE